MVIICLIGTLFGLALVLLGAELLDEWRHPGSAGCAEPWGSRKATIYRDSAGYGNPNTDGQDK